MRGIASDLERSMILLIWMSLARAVEPCGGPNDQLIQTEDGAEAWLHRHPADGPPVLVVHGVSSNHWCWDLDEERSLATTLSDRGFDTWFLDLRGHGCAERLQSGRRQPPDRSLDDYGRWDIPAALNRIKSETGNSQIAYIGHSMGGHVAMAYTTIHGQEDLSALVIVGTPTHFEDLEARFKLSHWGALFGSTWPSLPSPLAARMAASMHRLPFGMDSLFYAEGSLTAEAREEMYRMVVSPISRGELRQYSRILRTGEVTSSDGYIHYGDALTQLQLPLLVIAGGGDQIAPPDRVLDFYRRAGSTDKTWVLASVDQGFSHDYGHLDLTLGDQAPEEIHGPIGDWLAERLLTPPGPRLEPGPTECPMD
jgi:pimeloyl-ACP methyl ester carboxylesterase